jgi:hypothetical protein
VHRTDVRFPSHDLHVDLTADLHVDLSAMTKCYDEPIEVELVESPPGALSPQAFFWRGRRYVVVGLLKYWREAGEGWDPERARDHECFRVEARGVETGAGVYDLRFDRLAAPAAPAAPAGSPASPGPPASRKGRSPWRLARVWD